jgi:formylglycine-generating enzyme required for sulfatase activity
MKKFIASTAVMGLTAVFAGAPVIKDSSVTMTQGTSSREVTITYTLEEEPAIVTVDIRTNDVSIGGENLQYFRGDVNKVIQPGSRTITWRPDKAWPGHRLTGGVKAVVTAWATNTPPDYMVVSLVAAKTVRFYANAGSVPYGVTNDLYKTDMMVMRKCPAANVEWRMGSPTHETGRNATREVPHLVTLKDDYYIGIYPVTQRQFERVHNARLSYHKLDADYATRPVENITYISWRGSKYVWPESNHDVDIQYSRIGPFRTLTGIDFDLPTEAQWEFACRAGCGAALYSGKELEAASGESANLNKLGRYNVNLGADGEMCAAAEAGTAKVGTFEANDWGIYDMLGNVWELCLDWYQENPTGYNVETGPAEGVDRVRRGGSYKDAASTCRSAFRSNIGTNSTDSNNNRSIGVRFACPAGVCE